MDWITPTGAVKMHLADERDSYVYRTNHEQILTVAYREVRIRAGVFPGAQFVLFDFAGPPPELTTMADDAHYQLNDGAHVPVALAVSEPRQARLEFTLPAPLSGYDMLITGGTLAPAAAAQIEARADDVHRLYVPFALDSNRFAIDLEFRVRVRQRRIGASPASP